MVIGVLSVDRQVILATTALMPSVMAVMNFTILPRTIPTRFLCQQHHATTENLVQSIDTPTTRGTDHTPIMVTDIGDNTAGHSPIPIHTVTEAATLEDTPHAVLPAMTATCTTFQLMDAPTVIPTGIVTPHPTLTISPTTATHTSPWAKATLTPAAPAMQHRILSPGR